MTTQPDKAKDELSEKEIEKVSGGAGGTGLTTINEIQVQKEINKSSPVAPFAIDISPPFPI